MFFVQAIQARKMFFMLFQSEKMPFQAIKTRSLKKSKNWLFSKGVSPWFWSKIGHFFIPFRVFLARKMCFMIFYRGKTPFQAIKTRSLESRKIEIFLKGLVHRFGPKLAIFLCFLFRQFRPGICVLRYFRAKKRLCRL